MTKWLDYGKDHYATVSFSDAPEGRRTVIGWMSNWQYAAEVPTMQFRSANTLPRDLSLFRGADGQLYVTSAPSPEVDTLRGKAVKSVGKMKVNGKARSIGLPPLCEIELNIDPQKAEAVNLVLSNKEGEKVVMTYNTSARTFSFDRRESGLTSFSNDFPAVTVSPTFNNGHNLGLRIFIDRSSMEVFGDGGRFVMTNLVFPTSPYDTLTLTSEYGTAKVTDLRVFPIAR